MRIQTLSVRKELEDLYVAPAPYLACLWYDFCYQNPALWKELRGTWKFKSENASFDLCIVS